MKAEIDYICDRSDLLDVLRLRRLGLEAYGWDRLDMYWVRVTKGDAYVSFSVNPERLGGGRIGWRLAEQYSSGPDWPKAKEVAAEAFRGSKEEADLVAWTTALVAGGYFEDWERDGVTCPHCKSCYQKGTTHEHMRVEGHIQRHQWRCYEAQKAALGHKPGWRPGVKDCPSLEETGELPPLGV